MANTPLMPKATAVWLVDNTSLTFDQIANFCGLHVLEVKGIADGEVGGGIKGMDPIASGQLTRKEIDRAQDKVSYSMKLSESKVKEVSQLSKKKRRGPRYTPVSRRQDRPNAILWLLQFHPELKENEIVKILGTTKNTIQAIATGKHWNSKSLEPVDPVTLALCTQTALDQAVAKAGKRVRKEREAAGLDPDAPIETLLPIDQTVQGDVISAGSLADSWMKDHGAPANSVPVAEKAPTAEDIFGAGDGSADKGADKAGEQAEEAAALSAFEKLDGTGVGDSTVAETQEPTAVGEPEEGGMEDRNALYKASVEAVCPGHNPAVVDGLVKYLGIALRSSKDAATVACSDATELDRIKANFLVKKLGLELGEDEQEAACQEICEKMGTANRSKCRVAFYYLLAEKFGKMDDFI